MKETLLSLITGLVAGGIFSFLKLPIPAPNTFSGIFGVIGLCVGYLLVQRFINING